jgi:hypothetical protein
LHFPANQISKLFGLPRVSSERHGPCLNLLSPQPVGHRLLIGFHGEPFPRRVLACYLLQILTTELLSFVWVEFIWTVKRWLIYVEKFTNIVSVLLFKSGGAPSNFLFRIQAYTWIETSGHVPLSPFFCGRPLPTKAEPLAKGLVVDGLRRLAAIQRI